MVSVYRYVKQNLERNLIIGLRSTPWEDLAVFVHYPTRRRYKAAIVVVTGRTLGRGVAA